MSIVDKDIRPISHEALGGIVGTGLTTLGVVLYEPARNIALNVLSIRVYLLWLLLTVLLLVFVIVRLKKKLINLEREFKVISAQLEAKDAEYRKRKAEQNAQRIARLNAGLSNWVHGWRKW